MGTVFRLNSELPTPEAGTKIVKADEYSAVLEAGDLIKAAQKQADEIIQAAQRTYEQRYQQGYDDGVEAGKMENALKMMETVVASVEFIANIEKTVVSVVNQSVKKIIENFDDENFFRRKIFLDEFSELGKNWKNQEAFEELYETACQ